MLGQTCHFVFSRQAGSLLGVRRGRRRSCQYAALAAAVVLLLGVRPAVLGQPSPLTENQIIAQLIYKFSKATKSPRSDRLNQESPYVIGIWGPDIFNGYLDQVVEGKHVNGSPIRIARVDSVTEAENCQILFISPAADKDPRALLKSLEGSQVITMGKGEQFADLGGVFGFLLKEGKVRYEINETAAHRERIVIHSYVLKNALRRIGGSG